VLQFIKTKTFLIAAVVTLLVALYALAGFVLAPRLLRSALLEDIPKTLGVTPTVGEIRVNPFLRCDKPTVRATAEERAGKKLRDPAEVFAILRAWKDQFR